METSLSRREAGVNLFASLLVLALLAVGVALFRDTIAGYLMVNVPLNTLILVVFVVGACYALFWILHLQREFRLLGQVRQRFRSDDDERWLSADALSTLPRSVVRDRLMLYASQVGRRCAPNAESHAEGVVMTLDLRTSITRYVASLLVFLGLLGTFVGLLMTLGSIEHVINALPTDSSTDAERFFAEMKSGLAAPLRGMATAFSTSVFGLVTSLILGFIHLQLASAQSRFVSRLEHLDASLFLPAFLGRTGPAAAAVSVPAPRAPVAPTTPAFATQAAGGGISEGVARYLEATQRELKENLDRLMSIVERTESMQANYREVMVTLGREIETTNAAISRLSTNQDLMREATSSLVDLARSESESSRLMLSELKSMNEGVARLSASIQSAQTATRDFHDDLVRAVRREAGAFDKLKDTGPQR
ncbi:MotA/TolQ/ExbB proton channel family protein [Candidatus Sumerlaeota bacterium]|nr:MotA/TolQ/ExbB proton channel family protein [Candidatus Sumerlaeota bacterium]